MGGNQTARVHVGGSLQSARARSVTPRRRAPRSVAQELGRAERQVERLARVEAGVAGSGVAQVEVVLQDLLGTAQALGHVIAGELDVDPPGPGPRGVVDGDEIVVTGQKLWTSGASRATMMFVLCRTDPDVEKHAGLSYVLIPFTGPGVTYRPIRQMSGASEFCEDFLDGVRAPLFNVIGGLNNGWRVAMSTLGHERGGQATVQHLGFEREFWELADTARKYGKTADPLIRQELARAYTGVQLMRFSGLRTLAAVAEGRPPGPEASVAKLFWSEYHKRLGEIAMAITGADGLLRPEGAGYPNTAWQNVFLSSRAGTIYSGTSEIQRNIISERGLGLPREPRPSRAEGRGGSG